jgi:hypothetical protein
MLFAPGRRLFSIASLAVIVVAILHTLGTLAPPPPDDADYAAVERAMRGYRIPLGLGMTPSIWDIQRDLAFTMTVCLLGIGALGITLAADRQAPPRLLSRAAAIFASLSGVLTALSFVYRVPPPLISFAVVTVLYAVAIKTTTP